MTCDRGSQRTKTAVVQVRDREDASPSHWRGHHQSTAQQRGRYRQQPYSRICPTIFLIGKTLKCIRIRALVNTFVEIAICLSGHLVGLSVGWFEHDHLAAKWQAALTSGYRWPNRCNARATFRNGSRTVAPVTGLARRKYPQ